ncbi:hypothetical protein ACQRWP_15440 [Micromonospora trifolii]|uniref:hypothetical protein n=1 Tax=Micromonospora trifolii TaxID=2911208 RepID=UPI003D2F16B0
MDIHDQYERDAEEHLAAYGLRVSADQIPIVRNLLVRETRHEADTYAGLGTVPSNTQLMPTAPNKGATSAHAAVLEFPTQVVGLHAAQVVEQLACCPWTRRPGGT